LIDTRLYLPVSWVQDKARCAAAGVPTDAQRAQSKPELALEMVRHARAVGVRFSWVGMDALYGKDPALLRAVDADGERFMADVHKDQLIYLTDPCPAVPASSAGRGRKRTRRVAQSAPERVEAWADLRFSSNSIFIESGKPGRPDPDHDDDGS
jgi:SRSO17 transposase